MLSRIAPTPSGFLHRGNAANFLLTAAIVAVRGGQLLLRIDDLDAKRTRKAYVRNIFTTLQVLKIQPHMGPRDPYELSREWSQTLRVEVYREALARLRSNGHLYACDCSRKRMRKVGGRVYDGHCRNRNLPMDTPGLAWRIQVPRDTMIQLPERLNTRHAPMALDEVMGDFVVRKKDGFPAYQLASCVDDIHFGVTDVVRGVDLLPSSVAQEYLRALLLPAETEWRLYHHPLLMDGKGDKLSKSAGAEALVEGSDADFDRNELWTEIKGWLPERDAFWRRVAEWG